MRKLGDRDVASSRRSNRLNGDEDVAQNDDQSQAERRSLRSKYLAVINKINDERDNISNLSSNKFDLIINEVENLHQFVKNPREQVADAEALLDITNSLVTSVKSHSVEGISLADYINCLISEFGESNGSRDTQGNAQISINWKGIGLEVPPILKTCKGICTMLGPMNAELKERKPVVRKRRAVRPIETARPEELDNAVAEEQTDTDKNMKTMFDILVKKKGRAEQVKLESLVLNRRSFAQTVENLFALSFLVKDGRAEIILEKSGSHLVSPRNAPSSEKVMSGEATYRHFVFRFDFKDWKSMMNVVPVGDELMPHRREDIHKGNYQTQSGTHNSGGALPTTPIRKLTRSRGLVVQEDSVVEDSPEIVATKGIGIRRSKRRLN